jgi:predicted DNA-binding transcriptional regulator AlpA
MSTTTNANGERIAEPDPRPEVFAELLDVNGVSSLGIGSTRHIYRLSDAGRMPAPVKLGALVRWRRREIMDWIAAGCPAVRKPGRAG